MTSNIKNILIELLLEFLYPSELSEKLEDAFMPFIEDFADFLIDNNITQINKDYKKEKDDDNLYE